MWPGGSRVFRIDATVRNPGAERYSQAATKAGAAAAAAAAEKRRRYGPGVDVLALEVHGRLGLEGRALVAQLAAEARSLGPLRLGRPVGLKERHLRVVIEAALLRAEADTILLSLGATAHRVLGWQLAQQGGTGAANSEG